MKPQVLIELLLTNLSFKNACTKVIVRHNEQHYQKNVKRYKDQLLQPPRKHNIFWHSTSFRSFAPRSCCQNASLPQNNIEYQVEANYDNSWSKHSATNKPPWVFLSFAACSNFTKQENNFWIINDSVVTSSPPSAK